MKDIALALITAAVLLMAVELTYLTLSFVKMEVSLQKVFQLPKNSFSGFDNSNIGLTKSQVQVQVKTTPNVIHNMNIISRSDGKSAVITWSSDKPTQGVVEYGTSPASLLLRAPEAMATTNHSVNLSPLKANTAYHFRIRVGDEIYDNNGIPFSFNTANQ